MQVWSQATIVVAGVLKAWGKVKQVAEDTSRAYAVQLKAEQKLVQAVNNTSSALNLSTQAMIEQANALSRVTEFGDEVIISAQGVLAQFGKIGGDTMPRATEAVLDMAAALGTDASSAAERLGRALSDPETAATRLRRANIVLTESQEEAIDAFVAAGDQAGAMGVILGQVEQQFGGFAESVGQSSVGIIQRFENLRGDIQEKVGEIATALRVNLIETITPAFESILQWFNDNSGVIYAVFTNIGPIMQATATYVQNLLRTTFAYENYRELISVLGGNLLEVLGTALSGLIGIFGAIFEGITELAETYGMSTGEMFAEAFREGLGTMREAIQEWTEENITQPIRDFFNRERGRSSGSGASPSGGGGVLDTFNFNTPGSELGIRPQGPSLVDIAATMASAVASNIGDVITSVRDSLSTAGENIGDTLTDIYGDTTNDFQNTLQQIIDSGRVEFQRFRIQEGGAAGQPQVIADEIGNAAAAIASFDPIDIFANPERENPNFGIVRAEGPGFFDELISALGQTQGLEAGAGIGQVAGSMALEGLTGNAGELANLTMQFGALGPAVWAVMEVFEGLMSVLDPMLNAILDPLADLLQSIGQTLGAALLPVFEALAPIIATVGMIIETALTPILMILTPYFELLGAVLTIIEPILKAFAVALEVVMSPLRWFGDLMSHVAAVIRYAIGRITFWTSDDDVAQPGAFSSDAFTGLQARIDAIWAQQGGDPAAALALARDTTTTGGVGSSTSISRAPDQYFYFTFEGPVIGEAGKAEVGQFFMQAVQEYAGVGGRISLEIAGA